MKQTIKELVGYGDVLISVSHRQWKCSCLVRLPADVMQRFVMVYGVNLEATLNAFVQLVKEEHK